MRKLVLSLLCCIVCACGSLVPDVQSDDAGGGETDTIIVVVEDATITFVNQDDGGTQEEAALPFDGGTDGEADATDDVQDASTNTGSSEPTCEQGTCVVGHCLYNMATACEEFFSDHEAECKSLEVHPMGGSWWPGPCGGEPGTDLHRSSGGCANECGAITWSYRLGGYPPNDASRQGVQENCELFPGRTYIPTGL